jgi:HEAT repeat protein
MAVDALSSMLENADPLYRCRAAWGLGLIGDPAAVKGLAKLRYDRVFEVRWLAIEALDRIQDKSAVEGVGGFCSDEDSGLRDIADSSLRKSIGVGCIK